MSTPRLFQNPTPLINFNETEHNLWAIFAYIELHREFLTGALHLVMVNSPWDQAKFANVQQIVAKDTPDRWLRRGRSRTRAPLF
jgi:hypothetical protein